MAVKKTIASRQSWMLWFRSARWSSVSVALDGSSGSFLKESRAMGKAAAVVIPGSMGERGGSGGGTRTAASGYPIR